MSTYLVHSEVVDPASLTTGVSAGTEMTVAGVALGDFVSEVSFSIDLADVILTAAVTATDKVTVLFANNTAGTIDLGSGTVTLRVTTKSGQHIA